MEVAGLHIQVDSSDAKQAEANLKSMSAAAKGAEGAARSMGGATAAAATNVREMAMASDLEAANLNSATGALKINTAAHQANAAAARMSAMQSRNLVFQLNDIGVSLASGMNPLMVLVQQGSQIATIYEGGVVPAMRETARMAGAAVAAFWPLLAVVGALTGLVAGLTYEINKTSDVHVGFFDVALAGWQLLAEDIANSFAPVFGQLGIWMQQGWDAAAPVLKAIGNAIIGTSQAVAIVWQTWPAIMGDAVITAVNVALTGITRLLNESRVQILQFLSGISTLPIPGVSQIAGAALGMGVGSKPFEAPQFSNPFEGSMGGIGDAIGGVMGKDHLGEAFDALAERAQQVAALRAETDALGGSLAAANDNTKLLNEGLALTASMQTPWERMADEIAHLDEMLAAGAISWQTYGNAVAVANARAAATTLGAVAGIADGLSQVFNQSKELSIAVAVLKGAESVASAFASGMAMGGPLFAWAAAAAAGLTAAANVAAVMAVNPSSKSVSTASRGSAPTVPNAPQRGQTERAPERMDITLHGLDRSAFYSGENVESFLRAIEERAADGRILNIKVA